MNNRAVVKKLLLILVIVAIGAGIFFRLHGLNEKLFSGDEAETIVNSLQILIDGYPSGYYKGHEIFENVSLALPNTDPNSPYIIFSDNYWGSKYENNKGWLPYFIIAGMFKIFGQHEWAARLPFALLGILVIYLVYLISSKFFDQRIAYLATIIQALNPISIFAERIARYYVLNELLILATLFFYLSYLKKNKIFYWYLCLLTLVLLFHTHIIIAVFSLMFLWIYEFKRQNWQIKSLLNKHNFIWVILYLVSTLPWLILVKFWVNFGTHGDFGKYKLLWLGLSIIVIFCYYAFLDKKLDKNFNFVARYIIWFLAITNLLVPQESSFSIKLSIAILPLVVIILAYFLVNGGTLWACFKFKNLYNRFGLFIIAMLVPLGIFFCLPFRNVGSMRGAEGYNFYAQKTVDYLATILQYKDPILINGRGTFYLVYPIYLDHDIYRWDSVRISWMENLDSFLIIFDKILPTFNFDFLRQFVYNHSDTSNFKIDDVYKEQGKWLAEHCQRLDIDKDLDMWNCHKK